MVLSQAILNLRLSGPVSVTRAQKRTSASNFVFVNAIGIALYEKFGFEREGTHRRYAFRDGEYVDAYSMARIRG